MPIDGFSERPTVRQEFNPYAVAVVAANPVPLSADPALSGSYIDSFMVSVPAAAANSVFIGGPNVTIATGLELAAGSLTQWALDQGGRQQYDLQKPLLAIAAFVGCKAEIPEAIPFLVWDPSQICFIAAANTAIVVCCFRNPFV